MTEIRTKVVPALDWNGDVRDGCAKGGWNRDVRAHVAEIRTEVVPALDWDGNVWELEGSMSVSEE